MENKAAIIKKLIVPLLNGQTEYVNYELSINHMPDGSYLLELGRNAFIQIAHDDINGVPFIQCMTIPPQNIINILNTITMDRVEKAIEVFNRLQNVTYLPLSNDNERLKATVDSSNMSKTITISMYDANNLLVANISKTEFYHGTFSGKQKVEAFGDVDRLFNAVNVD